MGQKTYVLCFYKKEALAKQGFQTERFRDAVVTRGSNLLEDAVASEDCAEDDERNDYAEDHLDAVEWF